MNCIPIAIPVLPAFLNTLSCSVIITSMHPFSFNNWNRERRRELKGYDATRNVEEWTGAANRWAQKKAASGGWSCGRMCIWIAASCHACLRIRPRIALWRSCSTGILILINYTKINRHLVAISFLKAITWITLQFHFKKWINSSTH